MRSTLSAPATSLVRRPQMAGTHKVGMPSYRVASAVGVFVAALGIGLIFARSAPWSYDGSIMFQVAQSIASHGSLLVQHDVFGLNRPYSSYGIGMSLAMIPLYELAHLVGGDPVAA